jgi:hypothetical protein
VRSLNSWIDIQDIAGMFNRFLPGPTDDVAGNRVAPGNTPDRRSHQGIQDFVSRENPPVRLFGNQGIRQRQKHQDAYQNGEAFPESLAGFEKSIFSGFPIFLMYQIFTLLQEMKRGFSSSLL